jgi:hypothetical protein
MHIFGWKPSASPVCLGEERRTAGYGQTEAVDPGDSGCGARQHQSAAGVQQLEPFRGAPTSRGRPRDRRCRSLCRRRLRGERSARPPSPRRPSPQRDRSGPGSVGHLERLDPHLRHHQQSLGHADETRKVCPSIGPRGLADAHQHEEPALARTDRLEMPAWNGAERVSHSTVVLHAAPGLTPDGEGGGDGEGGASRPDVATGAAVRGGSGMIAHQWTTSSTRPGLKQPVRAADAAAARPKVTRPSSAPRWRYATTPLSTTMD